MTKKAKFPVTRPHAPRPELPKVKRGPKPGRVMAPEQRDRIQASQLINRLQKFVHDEVALEPAQVAAAVALLKKVMPDLSTQKLVGDATAPLTIITRAE